MRIINNDHLRENALIFFSNSLNSVMKEMYVDHLGEFVPGSWVLKG